MIRRSSGILLPIVSLPGRYGIGSLGREARAFADFLHDAGQTWWQILPVGPTGAGKTHRVWEEQICHLCRSPVRKSRRFYQ